MPPILGEFDTCAWPSPHLGDQHNIHNNSSSSLALGHHYNHNSSSSLHHYNNDNTSSRLGHGHSSYKNGHNDPLVLLLSHGPEPQTWDPVPHTSSSSSLCEEENSGGGSRSSGGDVDLEGGAYPGSKKKPRKKEMADKRKSRGRPLGSKNKPKEPIIITRDDVDGMRPHVLEVAGGCDVIERLVAYSRREQRGVCILGGSGNVANVTLRQMTAPGNNVKHCGSFQILMLSGAILRPATAFQTSSVGDMQNFSIVLVGASGQVVGGTVVGGMLAIGPVLLNVASFPDASIERLPLNEIQDSVNPMNASDDHGSAHLQIAPPAYDMSTVSSHMGSMGAAELLNRVSRVNYPNLPWLQAA